MQAVQHGERQADLGIQVAFAFENVPMRAQDTGHDFLGRCLTQAARDADDRQSRELIENDACHRRQCRRRRRHHDQRLSLTLGPAPTVSTSAAAAPFASACPTNACPSCRSPRSATNSDPATTARESTTTFENAHVRSAAVRAHQGPTRGCQHLRKRQHGVRTASRRRWHTVVREQLLRELLEDRRGHDAAVQLFRSVQSDQHGKPRVLGREQRHQRADRERGVVADVGRRIRGARLGRQVIAGHAIRLQIGLFVHRLQHLQHRAGRLRRNHLSFYLRCQVLDAIRPRIARTRRGRTSWP